MVLLLIAGFGGLHGSEDVGVVVVEAEEAGEALRGARHKRPSVPPLPWVPQGHGFHGAGGLRQANEVSDLSRHPSQSPPFLSPVEGPLRNCTFPALFPFFDEAWL